MREIKMRAIKLPCKNCGKYADAVRIWNDKIVISFMRVRGWQCKNCGLIEVLKQEDLNG